MFLLHVSTTRIYISAVLVAILLLAIPKECLFQGYELYTFGSIKPNNSRYYKRITLDKPDTGRATYMTTLDFAYQINAIKIIDHAGNSPQLSLSKEPPVGSADLTVTAPSEQKLDITIEVYVERAPPIIA